MTANLFTIRYVKTSQTKKANSTNAKHNKCPERNIKHGHFFQTFKTEKMPFDTTFGKSFQEWNDDNDHDQKWYVHWIISENKVLTDGPFNQRQAFAKAFELNGDPSIISAWADESPISKQ